MMTQTLGMLLGAAMTFAQVQAPPAPWRGAGPTPCVGADGGVYKCTSARGVIAVRAGRPFDSKTGPRYQVSTLGIAWGAQPPNPAVPQNPLASTIIRAADDGRAAVREQIERGADWIKLFPTGGYSFNASGEAQYQVTYPLPVLQA